MHMVYKETDASYGEESDEGHLEHYNKTDWQSTIGKTIISKDNFDMGRVVVDNHRDYNTSFEITIEYQLLLSNAKVRLGRIFKYRLIQIFSIVYDICTIITPLPLVRIIIEQSYS
jgi:hypothetical protein